jgi:shikimate kinase
MLLEWSSINITNEKPNFIYLIGGPGSGKSTIASEVTRNLKNVKTYSVDRWLELSAKNKNIDITDPDVVKDFYTTDDSKKLLKKVRNTLYDNLTPSDNVLIDLTGRRVTGVLDEHLFQLKGDYNKVLVYVMTPLEQCIERANKRTRAVDEEYLVKSYFQIQLEYVKYFHNFDEIWIVINDNDRFIVNYNEFKTRDDRVLCLKSQDDRSSLTKNQRFFHRWGAMQGDQYKYILSLLNKINLNYKQIILKHIYKQIDSLNTEFPYQNDEKFINIFINKFKDTEEISSLEEFKILNYLYNNFWRK